MNTDPRYPYAHIETGAQISDGCNLAVGSQISSQVRLAANVVLGRDVRLQGEVHLARDVIIGQNCTLLGRLQIDEGVMLAPGVEIGASPSARTHIRLGARVGAQARLLGGITIGQNAVIRSNSHVMGDVPDYALVSGDPAFLEDYVCPNCASRLSVVRNSSNRLLVYLRCKSCSQPEIRLLASNFAPRIAHILLPDHTPGEVVNLTGNDYRWLDDYEMR
jgi:acetyltransferase-like isoleucine patch superfamily enzyme